MYTVSESVQVYVPTAHQVRDAKFTGEVWALTEVPVKMLGKIKVDNYVSVKQKNTGLGRVAIYKYPYTWI